MKSLALHVAKSGSISSTIWSPTYCREQRYTQSWEQPPSTTPQNNLNKQETVLALNFFFSPYFLVSFSFFLPACILSFPHSLLASLSSTLPPPSLPLFIPFSLHGPHICTNWKGSLWSRSDSCSQIDLGSTGPLAPMSTPATFPSKIPWEQESRAVAWAHVHQHLCQMPTQPQTGYLSAW